VDKRVAVVLAGLAVPCSFGWAKPAPRRTVELRLTELARVLRCGDASAPDDPERRVGCLVALNWNDAKADPLPVGDTPLVGGTLEFPDVRDEAWRPKTIPAVGGMRVAASRGRVCEMDMYADTDERRSAIVAVEAPLREAFTTLTAPLVVAPAIAEEARERVAHAPSPLRLRGDSWTTRFQGAVELRHLGKRWFLIEQRRGDSGLWVSAFTADFTVAPQR
jgi:hypothetical protein